MTDLDYYKLVREVYGEINARIKDGAVWKKQPDRAVSLAQDGEGAEEAELFRASIEALGKVPVFGEKWALLIPARYQASGSSSHSVLEHVGFVTHTPDGVFTDSVKRAIHEFACYYALILQTRHGAATTLNKAGMFKGAPSVELTNENGRISATSRPRGSAELHMLYDTNGKQRIKLTTPLDLVPAAPLSVPNDRTGKAFTDVAFGDSALTFEAYTEGLKTKELLLKEGVIEAWGFDQLTVGNETKTITGSGFAFHCVHEFMVRAGLPYFYYLPSTLSYLQEEGSPPGVLVVGVSGKLSDEERDFLETYSNVVWNAISLMQIRHVRDQALKSAMRAGVSRLAGRGAAHNLGSNALQRLIRPGVLRSAIGLGKSSLKPRPSDHSKAVMDSVDAALQQFAVPVPDLTAAKRALCDAKEILETKRVLNANGEEQLRIALGYLKDRMELLAQIATVGSGLLETRDLASIITEFGDVPLLIDHMVTGGFKVEFEMSDTSLMVGIAEGPNGISALFNLFEGVLRNANRHTTWQGGVFQVEASPAAKYKDLIEVKIRHEWQPRMEPTKALEHIRSALSKPMLDDRTGNIRRGGWGMLEQKLVCAFLRELDLSKVDDGKLAPPLLTVDQIASVNGRPLMLVYTFHLPKPRDVVRLVQSAGDELKCIDGTGDHVDLARIPTFPIAVLPKDFKAPHAIKLPRRTVVAEGPSSVSELDAWRVYCEKRLRAKGLRVLVTSSNNDALLPGTPTTIGDAQAKSSICCLAFEHATAMDDIASYKALTNGMGMLTLAQPIGSTSSFGHLTKLIQNDIHDGGIWAYRLAEAATTPIVVLDERIQQALESEPVPSKGMTLKERLAAMGIFIPDRFTEVNLNDPEAVKLGTYLHTINELPEVACMPSRHVIIHRTVLQKLYPVATEGIAALRGMGFCPLWTSGAAGGADIGELDMDYVPFSMLERNTIAYPCKWQLVDMVMGAGIMNTE